jgi:hypothetical protein
MNQGRLMWIVTRPSLQRPVLYPRPNHVGFVALGQVFLSDYFSYTLSLTFHQCSTLNVSFINATLHWHMMASHNILNIYSLSLFFLINTAYVCLTLWLHVRLYIRNHHLRWVDFNVCILDFPPILLTLLQCHK